jgi:hypothetical protein
MPRNCVRLSLERLLRIEVVVGDVAINNFLLPINVSDDALQFFELREETGPG